MKHQNLLTIATTVSVLLVASCSNREHNPELFTTVPVTVHVDDFTVSQQSLSATKAAEAPVQYNGINALTLAFYQGSTEITKITQLKGDATTYTTFGDFTTLLPIGAYNLVAIAYTTNENSPFTLTSPTQASYTGLHAYETFVCSQPLNITGTNAINISVELDRIISQLKVVSTDGKTADVTNVRMTLSAGGRSFNPSTGLATSDNGFVNTVGNSAEVGNKSISSTFFFLASDEQNIDVTIETLDSQGNTLFTKTIQDVSFKRNCITTIKGAMYSASTTSSFQLITDWETAGSDITF